MEIKLYSELNSDQKKECENIYFLTSTSSDEKIKYKYFDYYHENQPQLFFVALAEDKVLGYVCGLENTLAHYEQVEMHAFLDYFRDELIRYPAHLHVNIHSDTRGKGIGRKLLSHFETFLSKLGTSGLHIITVTGEDNTHFYDKLGFNIVKEHVYFGRNLLFMGKSL